MFKCADVTSESQICKLQNGNESFSHQISYTQTDVFLHPLINFGEELFDVYIHTEHKRQIAM